MTDKSWGGRFEHGPSKRREAYTTILAEEARLIPFDVSPAPSPMPEADERWRNIPFNQYQDRPRHLAQEKKFDHTAATGFITLWGLPLQVASAVRAKGQAKGNGTKKVAAKAK